MAKSPTDVEQYSEAEAVRRRDEAIRRALSTPPKPHKEMVGKSQPPSRQESLKDKLTREKT